MTKHMMKATAAALALAVGLSGAAQAAPFNIFTASQDAKFETVKHGHKHRHHRRHGRHGDDWRKAAFAIGAIGAIAGAAAHRNRYYDDGYYYDEGPVYYDEGPAYYEDGPYGDCYNPQRPKHYPAPQGC